MILFRRKRRSDPLLEEFVRVMEPLLEQALYEAGLGDVKTRAEPGEGRVEALGSRGEGYSRQLLLEKVAGAVEAALRRLGWRPLQPVGEAFHSLPTLKPSTLTRRLEGVAGGLRVEAGGAAGPPRPRRRGRLSRGRGPWRGACEGQR